MSAEVIDFPAPTTRNPDNGAREVLIEIETSGNSDTALCWPDWILAELWCRGFKVVPLDEPAA